MRLQVIKNGVFVLGKYVKTCFKVTQYILMLIGALAVWAGVHVFNFVQKEAVLLPVRPATPEVQKIYNKVRNATDQVRKIPKIYMLNTLDSYYIPNAYVNEKGIYITYALADALKDHPDAMAVVIGHEIAHSLMHHTSKYNKYMRESSAADELMSDGYGAFLAAKAGYNVCEGARVYLFFKSQYGDNMEGSHPSNVFRHAHLQMNYCM